MRNLFKFIPLFALLLLPSLGFAQDVGPLTINLGQDLLSSNRLFQIIVIITVLSLAPSLLMMVTSFTRIVIVFSFLRSAMGLQATPPNTVLIALALFLSLFIMSPVLEESYSNGIGPYLAGEMNEEEAFKNSTEPFREFMLGQVRDEDVELFLGMLPPEKQPVDAIDMNSPESLDQIPLQALVPAFLISELRRAFEIGFLLFLPFLIIDLAVASILMSMGMMMLPPVMISMPFKIIFFVLVDGWHLLAASLVESFYKG
jgi:flagellar biosynthetic protein FliP